jgi:outer membrane lipoprotein-sorting protein
MTQRSTIGFLVLAGILPSALAQAPSPSASGAGISNALQKTQDGIKTYAGCFSPTRHLKWRSAGQLWFSSRNNWKERTHRRGCPPYGSSASIGAQVKRTK